MQSLIADFATFGAPFHPLDVVDPDTRWAEKQDTSGLLQVYRTARRVLVDSNPDVVHIELGWPNRAMGVQMACAFRSVPTAVVFQLVRDRHKFAPRVLKRYSWMRARGHQWIAVSENNRKLLSEGFSCPRDEIKLIYNGTKAVHVDEPMRAGARARIRAEFGLPASARILLTVGQLHLQKGYLDLVEVLPGILKKHPDITCLWAGEGLYREQIEDRIARLKLTGRVRLLGRRPDVSTLLLASDLFVFPTRFEGFPFSLLEAAAHGLPIVTTNASSIPEIMQDGVHGRVVSERDSAAMAAALDWALTRPDEMRRMAGEARRRAADFSESKMIAETQGVLDRLAGRSN
jgi:glycosyltransferase involved in cell wall biosynthesis